MVRGTLGAGNLLLLSATGVIGTPLTLVAADHAFASATDA